MAFIFTGKGSIEACDFEDNLNVWCDLRATHFSRGNTSDDGPEYDHTLLSPGTEES